VQVWEAPQPGKRNSVSPGAFLDWKEHAKVFDSLSLVDETEKNLTGDGEPERIKGLAMSARGLEMLRVGPVLGRTFTPQEDQAGSDKVIVLTHRFWTRRFGGDPGVIGQTLQLNDWGVTVVEMREQLTGDIKPTLLILLGAVSFVLLIACGNVASLLLAKASGREKEMAIRAALGATRSYVIRQLLTETVLLSLTGGALGILLAYWSVGTIHQLTAIKLPRAQEIAVDLRALGFALLRRGGRILRGSGAAFAGFVESVTGRHAAWDAVTLGGGPIVTFWHVNSVARYLGVARKFLELPRLLPALYSGIPFAETNSAGLELFGRTASKTWRTVCRKESRPGQGAHDFNQSATRKVHAYEWIGSMESVPGNGRSPAADDLFV